MEVVEEDVVPEEEGMVEEDPVKEVLEDKVPVAEVAIAATSAVNRGITPTRVLIDRKDVSFNPALFLYHIGTLGRRNGMHSPRRYKIEPNGIGFNLDLIKTGFLHQRQHLLALERSRILVRKAPPP